MEKMIADVSEVGGRVGLQLHPEKTKNQLDESPTRFE